MAVPYTFATQGATFAPKEQESAVEAPTHWNGDGHDDHEIRVHHSNVFLRIMGSMQLAAIGLHGWISGALCCCCIPVDIGAFLISGFLFLRGVVALLEVFGFNYFIFCGTHLYWENPFMWIAWAMLTIGGVGDIVAGVCGAFGVKYLQVIPMAVLPCWLLLHLVFGVFFLTIVGLMDTMDLGSGMTMIFLLLFMTLPDIFFIIHSLQALLSVTWKSTVAPSMANVLHSAERIAVKLGSSTIDKNHLVMALLADGDSKHLLEYGGVQTSKMEHDLQKGGSFLVGEKYGEENEFGLHSPLPLGPDATPLIAEAAREQWGAYESRLNADHLILALTSGGMIALAPKGKYPQAVNQYPEPLIYHVPNARAMREYIEQDNREHCSDPGPPPAPAFGCLPVEECIMAYIALQVFLCFVSVCTVIFFGRSIAVWIGLRTVRELRIVELISSAIGLVLGALALSGIFSHRNARLEIRQAAYWSGARWASELDEAWEQVRKSPNAPAWLAELKRGAKYLSMNFGWNVVQLFIDVPIILGILTFGDVCGGYSFGLQKASVFSLQGQSRMHCTAQDRTLIVFLVLWILFKAYMCWCMLALWHEYAYGWTTTELRGSGYLDPIAPLPQSVTRQLAGLPKVPQKRLVDEKTPLVL